MSKQQPPGVLLIQRRDLGETLVLELSGELDLGSTASLDTELSDPLSDGYRHIVLDLGELAFMDSRGLVTLVRAQDAARSQQKSFTLRRAGRQVRRLLALAGLGDRFALEDGPQV